MINMKNCKGMYGLARALAIEKGPRRFGRAAGYCLTYKEVKILYVSWGFSMKRKTMGDHLLTWEDLGWVKRYQNGEGDSAVYFFLFEENSETIPLVREVEMRFQDMKGVEGFFGVVLG